MDFAEDLTHYFADFGEAVTVAGVATRGIFDVATELQVGDALVAAPTLLLPASVAAADGNACIVRSATYTVRQVLQEPPDGAMRRLVLAAGA